MDQSAEGEAVSILRCGATAARRALSHQGRQSMSATSSTLSRRTVLAASAAAINLLPGGSAAAADNTDERTAIRPFSFRAPELALAEMRRRISAAIWPEQETVSDASQGVQLATMQKLARYWATGARPKRGSMRCRISSARSTVSTSISFTFAPNTRMRYRSSSRTDGRARSSNR